MASFYFTTIMIIEKIKYKEYYIVIELDTGEKFSVEHNQIPHSILKPNFQIDIDAYNLIKSESKKFECKQKAINYLAIKNRSEFDLYMYLKKKGFDEIDIKNTIKYLKEKGYLNDLQYSIDYINSLYKRKTIGKKYIKNKLYQHGLNNETIKKALYLTQKNEPDFEKVYHLAKKKYNYYIKHKKKNINNSIKNFLLQRGFDWEIIEKVINKLNNEYEQSNDIINYD